MVFELDFADYVGVRSLFQPLEHLPFCAGALVGSCPGRAFVDDVQSPKTAYYLSYIWSSTTSPSCSS
jgi:hypothetical protein